VECDLVTRPGEEHTLDDATPAVLVRLSRCRRTDRALLWVARISGRADAEERALLHLEPPAELRAVQLEHALLIGVVGAGVSGLRGLAGLRRLPGRRAR